MGLLVEASAIYFRIEPREASISLDGQLPKEGGRYQSATPSHDVVTKSKWERVRLSITIIEFNSTQVDNENCMDTKDVALITSGSCDRLARQRKISNCRLESMIKHTM